MDLNVIYDYEAFNVFRPLSRAKNVAVPGRDYYLYTELLRWRK